jgi:hypothetical protein
VNENGAKWKQLAQRAEADRNTASASLWMKGRYLPAYFTHMQQHTRKLNGGKPSTEQQGIGTRTRLANRTK